jgi:replicative DNA helicase
MSLFDAKPSAPAFPDAEAALLGALLHSPDAMAEADTLRAEHFTNPRHRLIFEAIVSAYKQHGRADAVLVAAELERLGLASRTGSGGLMDELLAAVAQLRQSATVEDIRAWTRTLQDRHTKAELARTLADLQAETEAMAADEALTAVQSAVLGLTSSTSERGGLVPVGALVDGTLAEMEADLRDPHSLKGASSGLKGLDGVLRGFRPGALYILAARPAIGKTALGLNFALSVARQDSPALVFSLEMKAKDLAERLIKNIAETATNTARHRQAADTLRGLPLLVDEFSGLTIGQLRTRCKRATIQHGKPPGLIVVDYLQLLTPEGRHAGNRVQEVAEISRGLKLLAMELDAPVLALAQLNRGVELRQDKHPTLADLRDSGTIEQDADVVMLLYRDDYYNREASQKPGVLEIGIAKNRHGQEKALEFAFRREISRVSDLRPVPDLRMVK